MLSVNHQIIGLFLNAVTIGETIFASFVSLIISVTIIYHFSHSKVKRQDKTILLLCFNIYLSGLIYMALFLLINVQTVLGDIFRKNFNSPSCILVGYIYAASLCFLYISFINQAFFRLCRIVYCQWYCLQSSWFYILLIPVELFVSFALLYPIYVWNDIIYLPTYHFCFVPISNVRGYLWIFLTVYGFPVLSITCIYIRIMTFMRTQVNPTLRVKRRQARELNAIRGILILIGFLLFLGLPTLFLIILMFITGAEHPLTFRITCISIGTSMAGLSLALLIFVPQLRLMIWKTFKPKPIVTNESTSANSTQMRSLESNR